LPDDGFEFVSNKLAFVIHHALGSGFIHRQPRHSVKRKIAMLITNLQSPTRQYSSHPLFPIAAKIARRRNKKSRLYKRAVLFLFFSGLPGLDFLPGSRCWLLTWRI
jgi:hypothetical protein